MSIADFGSQLGEMYDGNRTIVKSASAILSLVGMLIGGAFYVDARYAHAEEVQKAQTTLSKQIEFGNDQQRKKYLDDKIFEYDQIPEQKHSQQERAINNRYKTERFELTQKWKGVTP